MPNLSGAINHLCYASTQAGMEVSRYFKDTYIKKMYDMHLAAYLDVFRYGQLPSTAIGHQCCASVQHYIFYIII